MRALAGLTLVMAMLSPLAQAETASAPAQAAKPIFVGKPGEAPVPVVYRWLSDRIADENGLFGYPKLVLTQTGKGEDIRSVDVTVVMDGLPDDAVKTQRYQLKLDFVAEAWQIAAARQDWQCRRAGKGWTQRPCQ